MVEMRPIVTAPSVSIHETLLQVIQLAHVELPFAAQVAQLATQDVTIDELELRLDSLYRIAIEHGDAFVPDLVDGLLRRVEDARDAGMAGTTAWRDLP